MKCPLLAHKTYIKDDWPTQVYEDCLKEECAWWDRIGGKCGVLSLTQDIHWLKEVLIQVRDKMPYEEQFRR